MALELSIRSVKNCLAPSLFSAKSQTTEQLVTWGTASTPADPRSGGWSLIFFAISGSSFSPLRRRQIALVVHDVLRASMARTFPEGPQLSWSAVPASSYRAFTYLSASIVRAVFLMVTLPLAASTPLRNECRSVCKVMLLSRLGASAKPQGTPSLALILCAPLRRLP